VRRVGVCGSCVDDGAGGVRCVSARDDGEGVGAGVGVGGADCRELTCGQKMGIGGRNVRGGNVPRVKFFTLHSTPAITRVWS
jgi:hypothetical protein